MTLVYEPIDTSEWLRSDSKLTLTSVRLEKLHDWELVVQFSVKSSSDAIDAIDRDLCADFRAGALDFDGDALDPVTFETDPRWREMRAEAIRDLLPSSVSFVAREGFGFDVDDGRQRLHSPSTSEGLAFAVYSRGTDGDPPFYSHTVISLPECIIGMWSPYPPQLRPD